MLSLLLPQRTRGLKVATLIVVTVAAAAVVLASSSSFVLASGSDGGVDIYTPRPLAKLFALALFCAATTWALFSERAPTGVRCLTGAVGLAVLALATHAVVVSFKRSTLEERWLLVRFDRLTFDAAEGLALDWDAEPAVAGVRFRHRREHRDVYVFTGLGPWRDGFEPPAGGRSGQM